MTLPVEGVDSIENRENGEKVDDERSLDTELFDASTMGLFMLQRTHRPSQPTAPPSFMIVCENIITYVMVST